jgi:hypothetical protein
MKKILFALALMISAGYTDGFTNLNGHLNPMITTWIWIGIIIFSLLYLLKGTAKKKAGKAKIVPFK